MDTSLCEICNLNLNLKINKFPTMKEYYKHKSNFCYRCKMKKNFSDKKIIKTCCDNPKIIFDISELCENCGQVVDNSFELKHYSNIDTATGVTNNSTSVTNIGIINLGCSTVIEGNKYRVHDYCNNNTRIYNIYKELKDEYSELEIPKNVIDSSITLFLELCGPDDNKRIFKGNKRKAMKCIVLWYSLKEFGINRNFLDMANNMNISRKQFITELKRFNKITGKDISVYNCNQDITFYLENLKEVINLDYKSKRIIEDIILYCYNNDIIKNTYDVGNKICIYFFLRCYHEEHNKLLPNNLHKFLNINMNTLKVNCEKLYSVKDIIFNGLKKKYILDIYKKSKRNL